MIRFIFFDFFADKFKTDGHVYEFDAKIVTDRLCHACSDKTLYDDAVCGQFPVLFQTGQDIIEKQDANLVARKGDKFPLVVLDGYAKAVTVRIGAENDIGIDLLRERNAHGKRFFKFGIGHLDRGELRVLFHLLGHDGHVDLQLFEDSGDRHITAPVHGRIDELERFARFF